MTERQTETRPVFDIGPQTKHNKRMLIRQGFLREFDSQPPAIEQPAGLGQFRSPETENS